MSANQDSWRAAVQDLARYNGPVEICPVADGVVPRTFLCAVRLLEIKPNGMMVFEMPESPAHCSAVEGARFLWVGLSDASQRWIGRCRVGTPVRYMTQEGNALSAMQVNPPQEVLAGQRRDFYRLDTSGMQDCEAVIAEPLKRFTHGVKGRMLNLSGGGLGMAVDPADPNIDVIKRGRAFVCQFRLPSIADPMEIAVRLMHVKALRSKLIYLGLQFEFESQIDRMQVQAQVLRGITELEREHLRRQRRA